MPVTLKNKTGVRLRNAVFEACMEKLDHLELQAQRDVLIDLTSEINRSMPDDEPDKAEERTELETL